MRAEPAAPACYTGTHPGRPDQVRHVRRAIASHLAGCPSDYVWIEVGDLGGPWRCKEADGRPHGLDVIEALTGPDGWGIEPALGGGRIVWARLDLKPGE